MHLLNTTGLVVSADYGCIPPLERKGPGELRPIRSLWQVRYEIVGVALAIALILLASL